MNELESLRQEVELLKQRMKYLEDTFATLADMNKSGEMGQYIAQRQRALAASKLVNTAIGSQKLNADAQQQVIDQLAAEKAAMDARIEEAIRAAEQNAPAEDDLAEQFTYRDVPGGVEIQGFNGFEVNTELTLPNKIRGRKVIEIGTNAFAGMKFRKVTLPKYLKIIRVRAFMGCNQLTDVFIPNYVNEIASGAFSDCKKLKNIVLPDGLQYIGMGAFTGTAITQIAIPKSIQNIPFGCFIFCTALKKIFLSEGLKEISEVSLSNTNITKVVIPKSVRKLDKDTFGKKINRPISIFFLGKETQMEEIPNNVTIYCLPGSKIQQEAKARGVKVRPLSEFEYDENNDDFQSNLQKCLTAGCEE